MSKKLLIVFFVVFSYTLLAQNRLSPNESRIHSELLKKEDGVFEKINKLSTTNGVRYWLRAYYYFMEFRIGTSDLPLASFIGLTDNLIDSIETLDKTSPLYNFCITDIYLFRFFAYVDSEEYFNAITQLYVAERLLQKNKDLYPDFYLNQKQETIFKSIHFLIAKNIPLIASPVESSDLADYFDLLRDFPKKFNDDYNFQEEAQLYSILLGQLIFLDQTKSKQLIQSFGEKWHQKGPYEFILSYQVAKSNKDYIWLKNIFFDSNVQEYSRKVNYINYLHGEFLIYTNNDSAIYYIDRFIQVQHSSDNLYSAYLLKLWYYFLKGDLSKANQIKNTLSSFPNVNLSAKDKQVLNELTSYPNWNKTILRARLYYDGGDFNKALSELLQLKDSINTLNYYQRIEYSYRLARVYDGLGEYKNSLVFYSVVINSKLDHECYFPAYAAYYAGKVCEVQNDFSQALKYYKLCQNLNSPIYESSIHQKAEQAIVECNQQYKSVN